MEARIVKLTPTDQPIRVISETFKDALGEVNSEDNFYKYALEDYDDEKLAGMTDEQIINLVDEATESFDGDDSDFDGDEQSYMSGDNSSLFENETEMESSFDSDEFSYARGKRAATKTAKRKAKVERKIAKTKGKVERKIAKKAGRVEKIKAKRAVAQARIEAKNANKSARQANRAVRKGNKASVRQAKKAQRVAAKAERKLTKTKAIAERKAIRKPVDLEEIPSDEMQDGAEANDAGTIDYIEPTPQPSDYSEDSQEDTGTDGGYVVGEDSAPSYDEDNSGEYGGEESEIGEDVESGEEEPVATDDNVTDNSEESSEDYGTDEEGGEEENYEESGEEEMDGFNGLDADQLGGSLFENEMMSEMRGGKRKRVRKQRKNKTSKRKGRATRPSGGVKKGYGGHRARKDNSPIGVRVGDGRPLMGGYSKTGAFVPASKDQSQTDMQMESVGMSSFDGDDQSYFDGGAMIKGINWKMVALGSVLALGAIWAAQKYKLIK